MRAGIWLSLALGGCEATVGDDCPDVVEPEPEVIVESCLTADVSGSDRLEGDTPVVICSEPVSGMSEVDPDLSAITVRFSRPMAADRWSWVQVSDDSFPETTGDPVWLDARTQQLPVRLEPGRRYEVWVNRGQFNAFQSEDLVAAAPFPLIFTTTRE